MLGLAVSSATSGLAGAISLAIIAFALGYGVRAYTTRPRRRQGFW